jgi:hypothetical protein
MVPTMLTAYFVVLLVGILVVSGSLAWYWGVALATGVIALERFLIRQSHITDGDDELDRQHDAHLPPEVRPEPDEVRDVR